ncbi:MAG: ATP-dependent zinc metalloprotease FtsH [Alphaproteobacteria bacterium]|nr:ATP-dependent zinc metalloprotease FtsH [Alphaproteobacteria bacterium]
MNQFGKNALGWAALVLGAILLFNMSQNGSMNKGTEVSYSEFLGLVESRSINSVEIQGDTLVGSSASGENVSTIAPRDPDLVKQLREKGINISVDNTANQPSILLSILINSIPIVVLIVFWIFIMKQMQGGGKAMSFGKSRATMMTPNDKRVTFDDVAGVDEAKQELSEVVDFLKDPTKYTKLGGKIPKGVLLVGPPGTGKTLLARSVAGEADVPFFTISGSDFVEMFVGVGAARVRDLFEQGKKNAPCIIFIDEIDAVGRHRGAGMGGGNDEREQTLNQMLVEMDGFSANEGVILIAATNRPDVLDPALLRPGRFDRQVTVPLPDIKGRTMILDVHMGKVPVSSDVDAEVIGRGTPGFSGADLANLVNEAALMAARRNKRLVDMDDFESAKDKVMMGPERRSAVLTKEQQKTTAYHEAGHAILGLYLEGPTDPLHKVTIIPRGRALGVTMSLPSEDKVTYDKVYLENQIAMLMGGRIAEDIILGQFTTGASNDIERATGLARKMVCSWGMSKLGPINYGENESDVFMGRDLGSRKNMSERMASEVDETIEKIIHEQYEIAEKLLKKHEKKLHDLADALLEFETLDGDQVKDLFAGKKIIAKKAPSTRKKKASEKAEVETDKKESVKKVAPKKSAAKKPAAKKKSEDK